MEDTNLGWLYTHNMYTQTYTNTCTCMLSYHVVSPSSCNSSSVRSSFGSEGVTLETMVVKCSRP